MMLGNKTYDFVKKLVQVVLPAIGALYFGLGQIWGFPAIENVVGSVSVITVFLGTIVGISHAQYENSEAAYDGHLIPIAGEGKVTYSMEYTGEDLDAIKDQKSVRFKVQPTQAQATVVETDPDDLS